MKNEITELINGTIDYVRFDDNKLTLWYTNDKVISGAFISDCPEAERFFSYLSIYNTIIDTDKKIKLSLRKVLSLIDEQNEQDWNPFLPPSENEWEALYYIENAAFRLEILWDLLAQTYNIVIDKGVSTEKIHSISFFCKVQKDDNNDLFAKKVYEYMTEEEVDNSENLTGNHKFLKDYRNKLTHRCSPNVTSLNNFATELRMPPSYIIGRLLFDYQKVYDFLLEQIDKIVVDYSEILDTVK